ncbi:MAG: hypothetical protein AAF412_03390 [Pseudomonadota bacterium]
MMQLANGNPELTNQLAINLLWFEASPSGKKRKLLRQAVRKVLFQLWCQDKVVFPLGFGFKSTIGPTDRLMLGTEVLKFVSCYKSDETSKRKFGRQVEFRVSQHSLAWIYATDWHQFSRIELEDVSLLWDEIDRRHQSKTERSTPPSVGVLVSVLLDQNRLKFSQLDFNELVEARAARTRDRQTVSRNSGNTTHQAYFYGGIRSFGYFSLSEHLVDTQYEFPRETAARWNKLFDAFIKYRVEIKGFEDTRKYKRYLYVLADYIGRYLPNIANDTGSKLPLVAAPRDFKKYPFVDQADRPKFFLTILEFIKSRTKSPDSFRAILTPVSHFFDWIEHKYGGPEYKHIAVPKFRNPIDVKFDALRSKKRTGTNKVPFGAETLPHLMGWLYAVEKFGMHLGKSIEKKPKGLELRQRFNDHIIQCSMHNYVPEYEHLGEVYKVERIPLMLLTGQRTVSAGFNLSALRMLISAMELGLRFQSVQWLDRNAWDSLNVQDDQSDSFVKLFVNTDKSNDTPWKTLMPRRVRALLLRQEDELQRQNIVPQSFHYESRKHSRFNKVTPLFATRQGKIISDGSYNEYWKVCICAFAGFAFETGLRLPPLIKFSEPTGKSPIVKKNLDGFDYCPLKIVPLHTPHSARSTFITRRSGATDYIELSKLVGQADPIVTAHYDYPEHDKMVRALEVGELVVNNPDAVRPLTPAIKSGPALIKAKDSNSALRRSFEHDRDETIARFKIISLGAELKNSDAAGIALLRHSRAADIVFRDTHICPVGEECPADVVEAAGERMRCGTCKLACKSVDHLPAIGAKKNALRGQIRHNSSLYRTAKKSGNRGEELREIAGRIEMDAYELAGWEQSDILLRDLLSDPEHREWFLTGEPEIVRDHLRRVVVESDQKQFLATRILDAAAYPALSTDELRIKAARFVRYVQAGETVEDDDPDADIKALASAILTRTKALGLEFSEVGTLLEKPAFLLDHRNANVVGEK